MLIGFAFLVVGASQTAKARARETTTPGPRFCDRSAPPSLRPTVARKIRSSYDGAICSAFAFVVVLMSCSFVRLVSTSRPVMET
jgi:hypothetical protein